MENSKYKTSNKKTPAKSSGILKRHDNTHLYNFRSKFQMTGTLLLLTKSLFVILNAIGMIQFMSTTTLLIQQLSKKNTSSRFVSATPSLQRLSFVSRAGSSSSSSSSRLSSEQLHSNCIKYFLLNNHISRQQKSLSSEKLSSVTKRFVMMDSTGAATATTTNGVVESAKEIDSTTETTITKYEMTEDEKYLFDLNGYIIVRNVLTQAEIEEINTSINLHEHEMIERLDTSLRNAAQDTPMYGNGYVGRQDLGGVLEWPIEQSKIFRSILTHTKLIPYYITLLGKGYRLDHLPFIIQQKYGSEGFSLHGGTIDCSTGQYNPELAYNCIHNTIRCNLLGVNVILTNHNENDGGFCVVPGSHKSNYKMPLNMINGHIDYKEHIRQPITKAGDVILFSEGTVHGALPWTNQQYNRRTCLYRFAPSTMSYGRSYFGHSTSDTTTGPTNVGIGGWPTKMYENSTDAERAVLEPPYNIRLDRPCVAIDGETIEVVTRNERKKQHDMDVFKTKYF